jgi:TRAP-type C4-dicarboxylate transport system substrate-binding protein
MRRIRRTALLATAAAAALVFAATPEAWAQTVEMKVAHFVPPLHPISKWLETWAKTLETRSNGGFKVTVIPGGQMGPGPKYYDIAKTGQADVTWFVHGFTPGRFNLTEISSLPYLFGSGEIGSKVLNERELLEKHLAKEHDGLKILALFTHQPGNLNLAAKPVRKIEDMKGLRIRFPSGPVKELIAALGGTPVGIPSPEIAEAMQKGTLDGAFIDYGGAGIAFRLGPVTKFTTETYAYVASFCICMNARRYESLPPALKALVDETVANQGGTLGRLMDSIDAAGKEAMVKAGMTPIALDPEEDKKLRAVALQVSEKILADLEAKKLPAREVYRAMQALATKHTPGSNNFWK